MEVCCQPQDSATVNSAAAPTGTTDNSKLSCSSRVQFKKGETQKQAKLCQLITPFNPNAKKSCHVGPGFCFLSQSESSPGCGHEH